MLQLLVMAEVEVDDQTEADRVYENIKAVLEVFENIKIHASITGQVNEPSD